MKFESNQNATEKFQNYVNEIKNLPKGMNLSFTIVKFC